MDRGEKLKDLADKTTDLHYQVPISVVSILSSGGHTKYVHSSSFRLKISENKEQKFVEKCGFRT